MKINYIFSFLSCATSSSNVATDHIYLANKMWCYLNLHAWHMYHATTFINITKYKIAAGLNHPPTHGYQVLFPQPGCEAPTAKVNKMWSYNYISPYAILIWHLSMGTLLPSPNIISTTKYNFQQFFDIWYLTILPAYLVSPLLMLLGISWTIK